MAKRRQGASPLAAQLKFAQEWTAKEGRIGIKCAQDKNLQEEITHLICLLFQGQTRREWLERLEVATRKGRAWLEGRFDGPP